MTIFCREIRQRKSWFYTSQFNPVSVNASICTSSWSFQGNGQTAITLYRHIAYLHITEEGHTGRSPVFNCIWENIYIHKRTPGLSHTPFSEFGISMSQTHRGLAGVYACAKHFKFKLGLQFTEGCLEIVLKTQPCLAN